MGSSLLKQRKNSWRVNTAMNTQPTVPSRSDYFPWQRTAREEPSRQSGSVVSERSGTQSRPFSVATIHTACSSVCHHSGNKKLPVTLPVNTEEVKKRKKLTSILRMQIKVREISLSEYKKRFEELVKENISLKEKIAASEDSIHGGAKTLLQRYEKFRGAIGTLHEQYASELASRRRDFDETKGKVLQDIKVFQVQVDELNDRLLAKSNELKTLLNYKDKEYPEKALQIAKLKRQRERLRVAHKEELEELCNAIEEDQMRSYSKEERFNKDMRHFVNEKFVLSVNSNVKEMALQNMIMNKEVEAHQNEILQLEEQNSKLEDQIRLLLRRRKLNPAEHLFPDIFHPKKKCFTDDEVSLDIPIQTWLPI